MRFVAVLLVAAGLVVGPLVSAVSAATAAPRRWSWDRLADCESGKWDSLGRPIAGTANWASHTARYEGGVHFAPATWDRYRPASFPGAAWRASRAQQITIAERVLARAGAGQWPVCSRKVGMR